MEMHIKLKNEICTPWLAIAENEKQTETEQLRHRQIRQLSIMDNKEQIKTEQLRRRQISTRCLVDYAEQTRATQWDEIELALEEINRMPLSEELRPSNRNA